jgi:hypothetical protein
MGTSRNVWLGRLAVAGPIAFTLAWLIGGLVQDEYSFRREEISALAATDAQHAWIMIIGFVLLGAGTVGLAVGLVSTLKYRSAVIGSRPRASVSWRRGWRALTAVKTAGVRSSHRRRRGLLAPPGPRQRQRDRLPDLDRSAAGVRSCVRTR